MSDVLCVAAVQMSSQDDRTLNLVRALEAIGEAKQAGARLVLLPENFAYMGTDDGRRAVAEDFDREALLGAGATRQEAIDKGVIAALSWAARTYNVFVVGGGMPERTADGTKPYNTCVVIAPSGQIAERYRKMHLFDVNVGDGRKYQESSTTTPGDEIVLVEVDGFRVGLSICYDLRFPELYRLLARQGADVVLVPAAFTLLTGKDHWHVLLRARAIECQAYVVAAAQHGTHPGGRQTYGKTLVVDPWGDVIAQASDGEGLLVARIDREVIRRVRQSLPSLTHRRITQL